MSYLIAVSTATTIPLFVKTHGDLPTLSFPVVGSLSSLSLFATNLRAQLLNTGCGGLKIHWGTYNHCLTLILVCGESNGSKELLDLLWSAIVLLVGLPVLEDPDTEAVKRALQCCMPLLDLILDYPLPHTLPVTTTRDKELLVKALGAFAESASSNYCWLTRNNELVVATESWLELSAVEKQLLCSFQSTIKPVCSDIPVYLPVASNREPHRLVSFTLCKGVRLCLLCNVHPPMTTLQSLVHQYWTPLYKTLTKPPPPFPHHVDGVAAAALIFNNHCWTVISPEGVEQKISLSKGFQGALSETRRIKYLHRLIHSTVFHQGMLESYTLAKRYKGYVMKKDIYTLYVIFNAITATFELRRASNQLMDILIKQIT